MQILGMYSLVIVAIATFGSIVSNRKGRRPRFKQFAPMVLLLTPVLFYITMTLVKG